MKTSELILKLKPVVCEAFENGSLYAEEIEGVIYLSSDERRRFRSVGLVKDGFRRISKQIQTIAENY